MSQEPLAREDALILALATHLPAPRHTRLAIGDDAAGIALPDGSLLLVTTDMLMEDVHFRLRWGDLPALGWKALAQNLSDIAAMGGTPTHAVISLAVPPQWPTDHATALYDGVAALARATETDIVGGDTIRSVGPLTICLTVLGRVAAGEVITRTGAHPGDALFVTGSLGRAAAGLQLLDCGHAVPHAFRSLVDVQLRPQPRLAAARALVGGGVTAMMDLSDGVATDLHRLCRASHVGAILDAGTLPVDPLLPAACAWLAAHGIPQDPQALALCGGEDFELLLTAPPDRAAELQHRLAPLPLTCIGTITDAPELLIRAGDTLHPLGWGFSHPVGEV